MEKRKPHVPLEEVKSLVRAGKVRATFTALAGGATLNLGFDEMTGVVLGLAMQDFYKSMTAHANRRLWQDVYRPHIPQGRVYLNLTIVDDVVILSFKEL